MLIIFILINFEAIKLIAVYITLIIFCKFIYLLIIMIWRIFFKNLKILCVSLSNLYITPDPMHMLHRQNFLPTLTNGLLELRLVLLLCETIAKDIGGKSLRFLHRQVV